MFSNYYKIFVRTLSRQKVFSFINITGLAIGITCFIILFLFVLDEFGYDKYNEKAEQIYRVILQLRFKGEDATNAKTAPALGNVLKKDFPEVISFTRLGYFGQHNLRYNNKVIREGDIYTADSNYFDIFTLPFVYGDSKNALKNPNSIVISETAAAKYFGNENPLGKTFTVDDGGTYLITGVMKDYPQKSSFSCNFLLSMSTYSETANQDWFNLGYTTFLVLKKKTNISEFNNKMKNVVRDYVWPQASAVLGFSLENFNKSGNAYALKLQPLSSIYLHSQSDYGVDTNSEWGNMRLSNISYSYIFLAIGTFVLLIAVFNFMNLATAKSEKRAREVGIRKTLGSDRRNLIVQFISESIFTCLLSVILSVVLVQMALPSFNDLVSRNLSLDLFNNFYTIPILFLFACLVGFISGSYPAFYLSSFQSSHILKSGGSGKSRKSRIRSVLVITQFAISITLIIGTIIIKDQLEYIQNKNLGFNKDALITINNGSTIRKDTKSFQEEISKISAVQSSTASSLMFTSGIPGSGYIYNKMSGKDVITAQFLDVDFNFTKTYQIQMKEGRYFSNEFGSDSGAVVINEAMAKKFNDKDPVGNNLAELNSDTKEMVPFKIIGVVKDFNYESLHKKVRPLVLHLSPVQQAVTIITIRVSPKNLDQTIKSIEEVWHKFAGNEKMFYRFVDENLARMYRNEQKIATITTVFSFLAIIIACLGLFGLVSFITEQRTKEIGVRKVLGASVGEIILMVSKEFIKWVLLANLIAWPIAYYVMNNWLQNFAYRMELSWSVFIISGIMALIIAVATVSYQVAKVAVQNPVTSLRYE
ncbi:MAG: ABC transporter permease [Ignavibacteriaceae bacterium]|jgi:putative ABC transport system permease protein